jgi:hypothetical protein
MKKNYIYLVVFIVNFVNSQENQSSKFIKIQKEYDAIINHQISSEREENQELNIRLRDSTYSYYFDDAITICESSFGGIAPPAKTYYSYNSIGKLTELYTKSFNNYDCNFSYYKRTISYNSNNHVNQELNLVLDSQSQTWIPVSKTIYNYDSSNNISEIIRQSWVNSLSIFRNYAKYNYVYNATNNKTNETISVWKVETNNWITVTTVDYQYDNNDNLLDIHYKNAWDEASQTWFNRNHTVYNYVVGLLVEKSVEITYNNVLYSKYKIIYTNNSLGEPIEEVTTTFNEGLWHNSSKIILSYNFDNLIGLKSFYHWDVNNSSWGQYGTEQFTYNNEALQNVQYSDFYSSSFREYNEFQDLVHESVSTMQSYSNIYHYYPNSALQNESFEKLNSEVTIFPNPIIDFMTVSANENFSSIAIFNALGQLVFEKKVNAKEEKIDLTALTSGNYIVKINSETSSKVLKIIKQ